MKRLFLAALVAALTFGLTAIPAANAKAQSTSTISKTITAVDTVTWASVPSKIKGFQYTYTETSGTTAGKVYFEGTINGTYVALDSLTLADVGTAQTLKYVIKTSDGTQYKGYRFRNTNTSSATGAVVAAYLRRYDE